jgi:hypothetical protein
MPLGSPPVASRPKFPEHSLEAPRSSSKLLEASPLISTEALLDDTEEIEITWCYIRGIWLMKYSCELFIEKIICFFEL